MRKGSKKLKEINVEINQASRRKCRKINIFFLAILIGIIIIFIEYIVLTNRDMKATDKISKKTILYLEKNINNYENTVLNDRTNSLIVIQEKNTELNNALLRDGEFGIGELEDYIDDQHITGAMVIDNSLNVVMETNTDNKGYEYWYNLIHSEMVSDILKYHQKSYMTRIKRDGESYDFVACYCESSNGLVVIYNACDLAKTDNGYSLDSLFADCIIKMNGIIVVTDDDNIVASNSKRLRGLKTEMCYKIFNVDNLIELDKMIKLDTENKTWYGRGSEINGYRVFAFFNEKKVFETRRIVIFYSLVIFLIFLLLLSIIYYLIANNNLAQLKEYQKQLYKSMEQEKRANSAKTDFLRRMSHDIRTPINGIRGMVEISRHNIGNEAKQIECLNKIRDASGFLLDLVNSVLDMNKLESGEIRLEEKSFDIKEIIDAIIPMLEIRASDCGISIDWGKNRKEHILVIGSPLHLQQILQNIISNAIKYNNENGMVKFERSIVYKDDKMVNVRFICEDTGIGMSKEFQKKAFEPFAQEDIPVRPKYTGTGLGLAIVKELVDQMNGTITFTSELGKGTKFIITIPFALNTSEETAKITDNISHYSINGAKILVVEDNAINMEIIEFLLENEGAIITKAINGKECVDIFNESETGEFDIILMDIMMPVMNGLDATRYIRKLERADSKTVPIIAMTANAYTDDIEISIKAGMNGHLSKPLNTTELKEIIGKYYCEMKENI